MHNRSTCLRSAVCICKCVYVRARRNNLRYRCYMRDTWDVLSPNSSMCFSTQKVNSAEMTHRISSSCHRISRMTYPIWSKPPLDGTSLPAFGFVSHLLTDFRQLVAYFPKEVNSRLAKRPLVINGRLANRGLTSLVKEATFGVMKNFSGAHGRKQRSLNWHERHGIWNHLQLDWFFMLWCHILSDIVTSTTFGRI